MWFTTVWLPRWVPQRAASSQHGLECNHFLEWPGFGQSFCFFQARSALCAILYPAFQCCCSEMSVLCSSQNFIHKFNAVWFGGCCLASCQTVAKWFTEVQMLFLPAMWTTSACEYQFILLSSECVNSVGQKQDAGTEFSERDDQCISSCISAKTSASLLLPEHWLQTFFPALEGEWCQWCCLAVKAKMGNLGNLTGYQ